jgi:hypothetical protein
MEFVTRDEKTGRWIEIHGGRHKLCSSLNISAVMTLRRVMWAGHVARIGEIRN